MQRLFFLSMAQTFMLGELFVLSCGNWYIFQLIVYCHLLVTESGVYSRNLSETTLKEIRED